MATRAMKLKNPNISMFDLRQREVSARRQVDSTESAVNQTSTAADDKWWRNVNMEEGM